MIGLSPNGQLCLCNPPFLRTRRSAFVRTLSEWQVPHGPAPAPLNLDQHTAVKDGLSTRVQLLKGPPGTGKTVATATSVLARVVTDLRPARSY